MDAHAFFYETYELFMEEISHRIQSIYASKFYEGIGKLVFLGFCAQIV